jgi:membrane fusion protein, multidrug efflux system
MRRSLALPAGPALSAVLLLAGCCDNNQPNPAAAAPPPAVTVVKIVAAQIKPATTFTGRIEAKDKVDLRVRVDGFLEKRLFTTPGHAEAWSLTDDEDGGPHYVRDMSF